MRKHALGQHGSALSSSGPAVEAFRDPAGDYRVGQVRQTLMNTCRELRLLTDIPAPKILIEAKNAQVTAVTIDKAGATGVIYYSAGGSSKDPALDYQVNPSYTDANTANTFFTDIYNGTNKIHVRTWARDPDGVEHWSALTTYPETRENLCHSFYCRIAGLPPRAVVVTYYYVQPYKDRPQIHSGRARWTARLTWRILRMGC